MSNGNCELFFRLHSQSVLLVYVCMRKPYTDAETQYTFKCTQYIRTDTQLLHSQSALCVHAQILHRCNNWNTVHIKIYTVETSPAKYALCTLSSDSCSSSCCTDVQVVLSILCWVCLSLQVCVCSTGLCRTLTSSVSASAPVGAIDLEVIEAMMRWPPEYVFPGKKWTCKLVTEGEVTNQFRPYLDY